MTDLTDELARLRAELARVTQELDALRDLLLEAATDITVYVNTEYPADTCARYPDIARRHHRDLELVRRITAALEQEATHADVLD